MNFIFKRGSQSGNSNKGATSNKVVSKVMEEMEAKNLHCDVFMTGSPNALADRSLRESE